MRRRLPILLLVVLGILVAWWTWRSARHAADPVHRPVHPTENSTTDTGARLGGRTPAPGPSETDTHAPPHFTLDAHGIVVDEARRPQAGVEVVALERSSRINWGTGATRALRAFHRPVRARPRVVACTETDAEGRFRLEGLAADRNHHVQARPASPFGWVNASFRPTYLPDRPLEIVLRRGHPLRIRVVDAEGRGTRAWLDVWAQTRGALVEGALVDEEGTYVTPVVPDGQVTVTARIPGKAAVTRGVVAPHPGEIVIALHGGGRASVIGTVRGPTGTPIEHAEVVLSLRLESGGLNRLTHTDADGAYLFDDLPAGTLQWVVATAPDRLLARFGGGNRELTSGTVIEADLVLHPGHPIRGKVVDENRAPLPDVRVFASTSEYPPEHAHEDLTDRGGRFEVGPFPAGAVQLGTRKSGWFQAAATPEGIQRDRPRHLDITVDGPEEVEVVMLRGLDVPGRCVDPEDRGVAGMIVTAVPDWSAIGGLYPLWSTAARVVRTDADGGFVLAGLAPGLPWQLEARGAGHEGETGLLGPWSPGEGVEPVRVEVLGTARVQGRVVDPDGRGVEDVRISGYGVRGVRSGREGAFEVSGLAPGTVRLGVSGLQGRVLGLVLVEGLGPGETRGGIELRVPRSSRLSGVLLTSAGDAAATRTIVFRDLSEGGFLSQARTDAEGRFEVRAWGDGPYEPIIDRRALGRHVRAGEDDVELVCPAPRPDLLVRILDANGDPVPKVHIGVSLEFRSNVSFTYDVDGGRLRLGGSHRAPGTELLVTRPRDARGKALNLVGQEVVLGDDDAEATELVVRLEEGAVLRGVVVDESGAPGHGVRVRATCIEGYAHSYLAPPSSALADAAGRFEIPGLPRAPASLSTVAEGPWLPSPVVVVDGQGEEATLQVRRGLPFVVQVTDGERRPLEGVEVSVSGHWADRPWRRGGVTDVRGRVSFVGVAPGGGYRVKVRATGAARRYPDVELEDVPYGSGTLSIVMSPGVRIEGEVVGPDGSPVRTGSVVARLPDGPEVARTRLDGSSSAFVLGPIGPGTYSVHAGSSGRWRASVAVEVHAPARGLRLVLTRTAILEGRVVDVNGRRVELLWTDGTCTESGGLDEDGRFSFGVRDVSGALYAADSEGAVCALVEDVRPGGGPFTLRLVDAATIEGHVAGWPGEGAPTWVNAELGPFRLYAEIGEDGRFVLRGVPPGTGPWRLVVRTSREVLATREGVRAGGTGIVLELPAAAD